MVSIKNVLQKLDKDQSRSLTNKRSGLLSK